MLLGTQRVNDEGHLEIGGCDAIDLVKDFGTPLYVMDEQTIRENCRRYRAAFESRYPKNDISFASKAFLNMAICKVIQQEGLSLDVASGGEFYTAVRAGFPLDRVLLHGNNKSLFEMELALDFGVGCIVVDNLLELRQLAAFLEKKGKTQKILLRVTPGIDPHTHRRISVGQEDTKFGLSVANGDALAAVEEALSLKPHIEITGIHCHIGSQLLDSGTHVQAIDIMVAFMRKIADATGWMPEDLDIGGGLGIRYTSDQEPPSYEDFAETLIVALRAALEKYDVPEPRLLQEPGRALVGEAGTTLYTVGVIKKVTISKESNGDHHAPDSHAESAVTADEEREEPIVAEQNDDTEESDAETPREPPGDLQIGLASEDAPVITEIPLESVLDKPADETEALEEIAPEGAKPEAEPIEIIRETEPVEVAAETEPGEVAVETEPVETETEPGEAEDKSDVDAEAGAETELADEEPCTRTYVTIDGGMSDNPRPQLYDAVYEVLIANRMGEAKDRTVRIAGKHCETDILIQSVQIGPVETGDILAVQSTGAYNYVMASNYNRFTKPACVFVKDGEADLVSRRETLDDVVRLDVVPERLA